MRTWFFAVAWIGCGLTAGSATASDLLAGLDQVYFEDFEDFEDELAFPLTPEIDTLGLGAMAGHRLGNPLPLLGTLSGAELLLFVGEAVASDALIQSSGGQVPFAPDGGRQLGLRSRFDGFETVPDATNGSFLTAAVTFADSGFGSGVAGYLLDFQSGGLRIAVSSVAAAPSGFGAVFLSQTAEDSIRAGNPFEVELLFDLTARTAQAALTVGAEVFQTPATTSPAFDTLDIGLAVVTNTNTNNAAPPATVASDVQDFAIFVPAPGAGATMPVALATLAMLHRRTGRRDARAGCRDAGPTAPSRAAGA